MTLGSGGLAISNANVATAVNGIAGFAGTVTSAGAGNGGFTLTFAGASQRTDVPAVSIVNCTTTCTSAVRETAKGGTGAVDVAGRRDGRGVESHRHRLHADLQRRRAGHATSGTSRSSTSSAPRAP